MSQEVYELVRTIDRIAGNEFDGEAVCLGRALDDKRAAYALACLVDALKEWQQFHQPDLLEVAYEKEDKNG